MKGISGTVPFHVGGRVFQTWYKVVGSLRCGRRPLVLVHGGPGLTHHYMSPHCQLYEEHGIPLVLYDQLGSGQSSHYRDCSGGFFTPSLFSDQLESLLIHLQINDNYDLLGHSWGGLSGFLAAYFSSRREQPGLHRLILANAPASIPLMQDGLNILLDRFGPDFAQMIRKHEAKRTMDAQEYQAGMTLFTLSHFCSLEPWPTELRQSFAVSAEDETVHDQLMGEPTFRVEGTLKDETNVPYLSNITASTLVINSENDEMHDVAVKPFADHIPTVKWVRLNSSTHVPMFEEPQRYLQVISEFLA
ncbi:Alpha/Beta hydrolase protein [Panaeolus papilionaceus]|nr:Alpha/Beta hydrolase protein [Panaeolus papilionaceus]